MNSDLQSFDVGRRRFLISTCGAFGAGLVGAHSQQAGDDSGAQVFLAFVEPWTDPSRDMVVSWVSDGAEAVVMEYRAPGVSTWNRVTSRRSRPFPVLPGHHIHSCLIEGLAGDSIYEIRWPGAEQIRKFKTAARGKVKVSFLSDYQNFEFGPGSLLEKFGKVVAAEAPDLLVLVGDYVNDDGRMDEESSRHWFAFLRGMAEYYHTRDGALVPMVALTGNHEGINAQRNSNALGNGNGTIGQIAEIFTWSYDPQHPLRHCNSAATLSIGMDFFLISLETDHTEKLEEQLDWFSGQLAQNAAKHRHVVVAGHAPAFYGMGKFDFNPISPGRRMRNLIWPAMAAHASKIRFYITGHEHILAITDKLRMDYDPSLSPAENDSRWALDPQRGVRQLGSGPWGGHVLDVDPQRAGAVSSIDGSSKMLAAMGLDFEKRTLQIHGSGITNDAAKAHSIWLTRFDAEGFAARAVGDDGRTFYQLGEKL